MTEKVKNLIVGCGLSGMTAAAELAARGERVLIVDRREHIGGNIFDTRDGQTGITVPVWVTTGVNFLTVKWGASSR